MSPPAKTYTAPPPVIKTEPPPVIKTEPAKPTFADSDKRKDNLFHQTGKQQHTTLNKDSLQVLAENLASSVSLSRLPTPEPPIFTGDPLAYPDWLSSFTTLVELRGVPPLERIHYLKKYLGGPAKEAVGGCFLLRSEQAYEEAKAILNERYGNPFTVTEAFRNKIETWPRISGKDSMALRKFSDFLKQCQVAMKDIPDLAVLNDVRENRKMLQKLPDWVVTRWSRVVARVKKLTNTYPPFENFVGFIQEEADIACDPLTSLGSLRPSTDKDQQGTSNGTTRKRKPGGHTLSTSSKPTTDTESCQFCKKDGHPIQECEAFKAKPMTERQDFVKKGGYCFGCLGKGHISRTALLAASVRNAVRSIQTSLHSN
ncbi:uncharacterized protein [Ptychodera flava]|uniref:uncharacterized protein n=1 Tax=Ptychodera flava TaxID=63121 RepID=UPI003969C51B